ncbi:MAG: hypothetical protein ACI9Y1_000768, partial [Lentisphaeria bacterium]
FDRYREASVFTDFDLFSFWCIICIEGNVKLTLSRKEAFSCTKVVRFWFFCGKLSHN